MRKLVLGLAAATLPWGVATADSYTIDESHTYPHFSISHVGFSTMHGRFNKTTGKMELDTTKKTGSVEITIDAASIDTSHAKRDEHLRSPDFFNAKEHPTITFKSTKANFSGDKISSVDGSLTIMGVTKPVTLTVTSMKCDMNPFSKKYTCGFDANTKIKRSDFGVNYGLPGIGDDVTITLELEAIKS
jgi:polyisoprenoid-binding protein YceI